MSDKRGHETIERFFSIRFVTETSVANNSPSQDSSHPSDLFQSRYVTPEFKPFSCKEIRL